MTVNSISMQKHEVMGWHPVLLPQTLELLLERTGTWPAQWQHSVPRCGAAISRDLDLLMCSLTYRALSLLPLPPRKASPSLLATAMGQALPPSPASGQVPPMFLAHATLGNFWKVSGPQLDLDVWAISQQWNSFDALVSFTDTERGKLSHLQEEQKLSCRFGNASISLRCLNSYGAPILNCSSCLIIINTVLASPCGRIGWLSLPWTHSQDPRELWITSSFKNTFLITSFWDPKLEGKKHPFHGSM